MQCACAAITWLAAIVSMSPSLIIYSLLVPKIHTQTNT